MSYYVKNNPMDPVDLEIGERVRLTNDYAGSRWWTVRAVAEGVVVLSRQAPFRSKGELLYTVIDWRSSVRGPVNVIGQGWDVTTDEQCQELADVVSAGKWEISQRNWVPVSQDMIVRTAEAGAA